MVAATVLASDGRTVMTPGWNRFSALQDIELGEQVAPAAERQLRLLGNARVGRYVTALGRLLAAKAPGERYPYEFQVVNDASMSAFALPGGSVYINRGVFDSADTESQLAGVIAHQVAHVALRHGTTQASAASVVRMPSILGGAKGESSTNALAALGAGFASDSVLMRYSRAAETDADIIATQVLYDAGYDPRGLASFFDKVDIEARQSGRGEAEFFSNHPNPDHRIRRVTEEVSALGGLRPGARTNSVNYDDIKRYVRSLPAAPSSQPVQVGRVDRERDSQMKGNQR